MADAGHEGNSRSMENNNEDVPVTNITQSPELKLLDVIPWEDVLYIHVFPLLDLPSLFYLRAANNQCRTCVEEYFTCCRIVDLARYSSRITPAVFKLITPVNPCMQSLVVRSCKWLTDALLVPVLDSAESLHTLDLSHCTSLSNASLQKVAISCPQLSVLLLRDCHWLSMEGLMVLTLHSKHLTRLDITACWEINDNAVMSLVNICTKLEYLSIARIYGITDRCIRFMAQHCRNLVHLNMQGCWRITDDSVRFLGEYCTKLKALQVRECREVTEASLARLRVKGIKVDVPPHPWQLNPSTQAYLRKIHLQI